MRIRSVFLSALLTLSLAAGLAAVAVAVPATPASAACTVGAVAYSPYRSGSWIRSTIKVTVSCSGYLRVSHSVLRNGSQIAGWQKYYDTPYTVAVSRLAGTCRSGRYQAKLGIYLSGPNGVSEGRYSSREVSISC